MAGSTGGLGIRLSRRIIVDGFSIEHVDARIQEERSSAPKSVTLYGRDGDEQWVIGSGEYALEGGVLQSWDGVGERSVRDVVLGVEGNWGHDAWTCLYRVRVHGRIVEE
jgi:hypothetical protein